MGEGGNEREREREIGSSVLCIKVHRYGWGSLHVN